MKKFVAAVSRFGSNVKFGFKSDMEKAVDIFGSLVAFVNVWGQEGEHRLGYNSAAVFAMIKPREGVVASHRWGLAPGTGAQHA